MTSSLTLRMKCAVQTKLPCLAAFFAVQNGRTQPRWPHASLLWSAHVDCWHRCQGLPFFFQIPFCVEFATWLEYSSNSYNCFFILFCSTHHLPVSGLLIRAQYVIFIHYYSFPSAANILHSHPYVALHFCCCSMFVFAMKWKTCLCFGRLPRHCWKSLMA